MKRSIILWSVILISITGSTQSGAFFETGSVYLSHQMVPHTITLSNGVKLEYVEQGKDATAVIFLHGFSDSWHSFDTLMKMLPPDFHLVSLSQRGHGNSSKPNVGYHPKDFANDLSLFINEKKLGASIIVGHSMGGYVAQQFAVSYPGLTKALVLIDTDAYFADNPGFTDFTDEILKFERPVDYSFARDFQLSTLSKPLDSLQLALFIDESMKLPLHVWKGGAAGLVAEDFTKDLQKIDAPVLIFWGSKDMICFKVDQENFTTNLKNEKLIVYEGTGHALHWEEPERFTADLASFIKGM
ncbi:MAG TPA: alpha/beta hydrolase [Chitinophagaceae bacterium]|nr:alpha/beta hydrolase [Chitinophagaceae bacterium]